MFNYLIYIFLLEISSILFLIYFFFLVNKHASVNIHNTDNNSINMDNNITYNYYKCNNNKINYSIFFKKLQQSILFLENLIIYIILYIIILNISNSFIINNIGYYYLLFFIKNIIISYCVRVNSNLIDIKLILLIFNFLNVFVITGDLINLFISLEITSYTILFILLKFLNSKCKNRINFCFYVIILNFISLLLITFSIFYLIIKYSSYNIYNLNYFFYLDSNLNNIFNVIILVIIFKLGIIPSVYYNIYLYKSLSLYFIGIYNLVYLYYIIIIYIISNMCDLNIIIKLYLFIINIICIFNTNNVYSSKEFLALSSTIFYINFLIFIL